MIQIFQKRNHRFINLMNMHLRITNLRIIIIIIIVIYYISASWWNDYL
jgi:hypothetical protein